MMQNRSAAAPAAMSGRIANQQPAASDAHPSANGILALLPPIVPSIGFSRGTKSAAASDAAAITNDPASPGLQSKHANAGRSGGGPNDPAKNIPHSIKLGNRLILTSHAPRQWAWKSFHSSARHDDAQFYHWVRANVEYADYPYARFDVSLDPLTYTEEEYKSCLEMGTGVGGEKAEEWLGRNYDLITGKRRDEKDETGKAGGNAKASEGETTTDGPNESKNDNSQASLQELLSGSDKVLPWTKAETDALMELARAFDLRWPVIIDRWHSRFKNTPTSGLRKVEDLQHRYYSIGSMLAQKRVEMVMAREAANLAGGGGAAVVPGQGGEAGAGAGLGKAPGTASAATSRPVPVGAPSSALSLQKDGSANVPAVESSVTGDAKPPVPTSAARQQSQPSSLPPAEVESLGTSQQLTALHPSLAPPLSLPGTGTAHRGAKMFDLAAERARRAQMDRMWNRSKEEEREEEELRAELRAVEAQLRRLKKGGKHLVPAGSALAAPPVPPPTPGMEDGPAAAAGAAAPSHPASAARRPATAAPPHPAAAAHHRPPTAPLFPRPPPDPFLYTRHEVSASFADTAPVPTPGTPYLQSGRLFPPSVEGHAGLNKSTLKQMGAILAELRVPKEPIPTKRSCDLYDGVRKDALTLLILQKMVMRKEAELTAKRAKLATMREEAVARGKAEEGKDAKEEGAKGGGKGKKGGSKVGKGKRPRADSGASAASAQGAVAAVGEGGAGKKGGEGSKKMSRKKSFAAMTPPVTSMATPAGVEAPLSFPATGSTASHAVMPPPVAVPSNPSASVSPIIASRQQHPQQPPLASVLPPPSAMAAPIGTEVADTVTVSTAAPPPAIHPGKTAKKAGRKPRGRKKATG